MKNYVEQMVCEIEKKLSEKLETEIVVGFDFEAITLHYTNSMNVLGVSVTTEKICIDNDIRCSFEIGMNYSDLIYDEYEDEYIFKYENGMSISIALI